MSPTLAIAIWGAVLATAAIIWDILKWRSSGPRLRISARANSFYSDRLLEPQDDDFSIAAKSLRPFIHIELVNTGTLPTTLLAVEARLDRRSRFGRKRDNSISMVWRTPEIEPHFGKNLPSVLGAGDVWSGRLDQTSVLDARKERFPEHHFYVVVSASHREREIRKRIFGPKNDYGGRSMTPTSSETVKMRNNGK